MDLGEIIHRRRTELGISAACLGKMIGKDTSTIYRYERGSIRNCPGSIIELLAKALEIPADTLTEAMTPARAREQEPPAADESLPAGKLSRRERRNSWGRQPLFVPDITITASENRLLAAYRRLEVRDQTVVLTVVEMLVGFSSSDEPPALPAPRRHSADTGTAKNTGALRRSQKK